MAGKWHNNGMTTTIDKAGRVVIPAPIREELNLAAGTPLEIRIEDFAIRIVRSAPGPKIVRVGKLLVARPTVPRKDLPKIDVAKLIEEERDRWPW